MNGTVYFRIFKGLRKHGWFRLYVENIDGLILVPWLGLGILELRLCRFIAFSTGVLTGKPYGLNH
jgi:hypothetical protein